MTSFLFWNLNQKQIPNLVSNLAILHSVDVIMLTECAFEPPTLLNLLNQQCSAAYHYVPKMACEKVEVFTQFPSEFIKPIEETARITIRQLKLPGLVDILLAIVHFPSKLYWKESSQALESVQLSDKIKDAERRIGHSRTVLVGDLNMNPFELGVVGANALHGVMTKSIAEKGSRIVQSVEYPFFYNPMWSLLGDRSAGPAGTHFYSNAEHEVLFWNMFDQMLVRPDLLSRFDNKDLQILDSDGKNSFLSPDGTPNANSISDHLPILFKISL